MADGDLGMYSLLERECFSGSRSFSHSSLETCVFSQMHVAPCRREKNAGEVCVLVGQRAECLGWSFSIIPTSAREAERPT